MRIESLISSGVFLPQPNEHEEVDPEIRKQVSERSERALLKT